MPRFVARPVVVEAHQYNGHVVTMPEAFRLAVKRYLQGGEIDVLCGDVLRRCRHGDWIMRLPDGLFEVVGPARIEAMYEDLPHKPPPLTPVVAAARAANRKEKANV